MTEYWILDGHEAKPCATVEEWGRMFERDKRRVDRTEIGDVSISTVFLGIDHSWGDGPPLLFETMVFGGPLDGEQDRYSTWDQAQAGHNAMVERVTATPPTPRGEQ